MISLADEAKLVRELPIDESIKVILKALIDSARELGLADDFSDLKIKSILPEGPALVIYLKRRDLVGNDEIAKRAARKVKKRMELRAAEEARDDIEEAKRKILGIIPQEAGVEESDLIFDERRSIVEILASEPRLVIGSGGEIRKRIIAATGRIPKVIKKPELATRSMQLIYRAAVSSPEAIDSLISIGLRIHRPRIYKERSLRLTFLGAAHEIGRSSILIQTPNSNILVDFGLGMSVGSIYPRIDIPGISLEDIDAVVLTHAPMDHAGLIPRLYTYGYRGPVYMTTPTRDLAVLLRFDYIKLSRRLGITPPYSEADVYRALQHTITIDYNLKREEMRSDVTDISPDVRLTLYNAGHILGSAIVHLHIGDGMHNIVIAQDFRYSDSSLLDRASSIFPRVETLIIESTYGGKNDDIDRKRDEHRLIREIKKTLEEGGRVLVPVLSVGRAQEVILKIYYAMKRRLLPEVPVFIDGMVADATAIHTAHTEFLSRGIRRILRRENPFKYEQFIYIPEWRRSGEELQAKRDEVLSYEKPSIILASNGMLNGGPSVEYFKSLAGEEKNKIIFVSYQAPGTLGYSVAMLAKKKNRLISIGSEEIEVKAKIVSSIRGLTSHSTYSELMSYVRDLKASNRGLRNVFVIHGDPKKCESFARDIREELGLHAIAPSVGETIKVL